MRIRLDHRVQTIGSLSPSDFFIYATADGQVLKPGDRTPKGDVFKVDEILVLQKLDFRMANGEHLQNFTTLGSGRDGTIPTVAFNGAYAGRVQKSSSKTPVIRVHIEWQAPKDELDEAIDFFFDVAEAREVSLASATNRLYHRLKERSADAIYPPPPELPLRARIEVDAALPSIQYMLCINGRVTVYHPTQTPTHAEVADGVAHTIAAVVEGVVPYVTPQNAIEIYSVEPLTQIESQTTALRVVLGYVIPDSAPNAPADETYEPGVGFDGGHF